MSKHHDLVDVSLLMKFLPKSGKSIAVTDGIKEEVIFLPLSEIEYVETGKWEGGYQLISVCMPQWLAEEKGFV
jgi:hypothetical protein